MTAMLFERFLSGPAGLEPFGDAALLQRMLDVEAALVRAQAAEGVVPGAAAGPIVAACRADRFDIDAIVAAGAAAGTLVIPLVKRLTALVAETDPAAAGYVHWGTTSQDVIDTAMVLATRTALAALDLRLAALSEALFALEERHGAAPMLGRTLLQPALVIGFGNELLNWTAPLVRARERLRRTAATALRLQLGGAVGTLAALGPGGAAVARRMADDLGLAHAPGNWHTQRDEWLALACEIGLVCGSLGKIGKDIALLAQGEVAELAEPSGGGRGGSSAMPHKRNPVAAMVAISAATRAPQRLATLLAAMPQEHQRGLGNWQAELAEWPGLFVAAWGAADALATAAGGLAVDPARMRRNIDALGGLVFAEGAAMLLAPHLGKARAQGLLETLSRQAVASGRPLFELTREAVEASATLGAKISATELQAVFDAEAVARLAVAAVGEAWTDVRRRHASLSPAPFG